MIIYVITLIWVAVALVLTLDFLLGKIEKLDCFDDI
jgi:hypothetical protein